jgi:predicted  nucleic acid-binding Zn-ribbon protein
VRSYKQTIATLKQEKASVESELQTVKAKYEQLKPFEDLLTPEFEAELLEAEEQASLVEQTIQEMLDNPDPDLSDIDKQLLLEFQNDTDEFLDQESNGYHSTPAQSSTSTNEQPTPTP